MIRVAIALLVIPATVLMCRAFILRPFVASSSHDNPYVLGDGSKNNCCLDAHPPLDVAIVGAGPSGLLTAHLLLQQENTRVTLVEARSDPRKKEAENRAYALGIGVRGRSSIRNVDEALWSAVKSRGYESERFQLHIGGFVVPLRSEEDSRTLDGGEMAIEPSLLTYQTDLCGALLDELKRRYNGSRLLQIYFDSTIQACNLETMTLSLGTAATDEAKQNLSEKSFDLLVGSDGVNSVVRSAMEHFHPSFRCTKELLPGEFKVVRLDHAPPNVDPTSVSLVLPRAGATSAFVEPTDADGSCCVLFAGGGDSTILSETKNQTAVCEALQAAFPQWEPIAEILSTQLTKQHKTGTASSVQCNTFHYNDRAVLVGDAAHATGGVSGQGVNSALQDCVALADCIENNRNDLAQALLSYSERQVPEAKALYDLSFGPKPKGFKALLWAFRTVRDTVFRGRFGIGKAPLQTRLTTTMTPFSEIRRESDSFYAEQFPSGQEIQQRLLQLHSQAMEGVAAPIEQQQ